uniref:Uncharacterized protein n=1 Tax=Amazona collaria TaxID=241587 RepID=A0A8B9FTP1_9PSIT
MGLKTIWKDYKVLIVMGIGLGLVHWGWFHIKSSPLFQVKTDKLSDILGLKDISKQTLRQQHPFRFKTAQK